MKTILITGSNRGIGFQIAKEMAALGWHVIATARDLIKLKNAFDKVEGKFTFLQLDVTDSASLNNALSVLSEKQIQLDALVNNAGISLGKKGLVDTNFNEVEQTFDVNFFGVWHVIQHFIPLIKKDQYACIINMSSGMGAQDDLSGNYASYRLSKAALNAMGIFLSNELKSDKILVHTMCPGWVQTDMGGPNAPRTLEKGAETAIYLATQPALPTGRFWRDSRPINW